jgi:hypothetical protein
MMKPKAKADYRVRNWSAYDAAPKQKGSITFGVDKEVLSQWLSQQHGVDKRPK